MTRYFTRGLLWTAPVDLEWEATRAGERQLEPLTVFEADTQRNTGLVDADGNSIWATDRRTIGFIDQRRK